jgi:flagellar hook assembly protein FlgD
LRGANLGAVLFAVLVLLSIGAFAIERAARSSDDVVNTVVLTSDGSGGRIEFTLAKADVDVDVLIIDGNEGSDGELVRTLESGAALESGPHVYRWDGRDDEGRRAPPGLYAIEVVLGDQDRDVRPPGRIEVSDRGYALDFGEQP